MSIVQSLSGLQGTVSQSMTALRSLRCASKTVATVPTTVANIIPVAHSSVKTPTSDLANGRIVVASEGLNYIKVIPAFTSAVGTTYTGPNLRIYGWNFDDTAQVDAPANTAINAAMWYPQAIAKINLTLASSGVVHGNLNAATAFLYPEAMTVAYGDAKLYQPASANGGGFIVVDTMGCQYIEFIFNVATKSTASVSATAFWSSL